MTRELQLTISNTQAKADTLERESQRAAEIVERMRKLAVKDEWTMAEEYEWAEMEKQARMLPHPLGRY